MLEVEYKARVEDLEAVRARLQEHGAVPAGAETQRDSYFAHPIRDFAATDEALRIRSVTQGDTTRRVLTYKGVRLAGPTRSREEIEVAFEGDLDRVLAALSFRGAGDVQKTRHAYRLGDVTVTLDQVAGLGSFVEVETLDERDALEAARARVLAVVRMLGLGAEETRSYLEMVLQQQRDS